MTETERKRDMCACIYTPSNDYLVGAMVTCQSGSGMTAAVLHLVSQTPFSPFFSSSYRQYEEGKKKKIFVSTLTEDYLTHFLLFIIYCSFDSGNMCAPWWFCGLFTSNVEQNIEFY